VRGKLRDKRALAKRDFSRREVTERRRPGKRDTRSMIRQSLQMEEDLSPLDVDDEEPELEMPHKK
jgi:hypothetical protein